MKKAQILLIEDTDSVREVLKRQLEVLGADVTALADGEMVKRELDRKKFDLVIADLHLPDCSGVDIARFAQAKKCRSVLVSGDANAASNTHLLNIGFDQVLIKPVTIEHLQKLLMGYHLIVDEDEEDSNNDYPAHKEPEFDETGAISISALREQMGDLDHIALEMLSRFPQMMRPKVFKMIHSLDQMSLLEVFEIAHSLKGAARSAGALQLGMVCEVIQEAATRNKMSRELAQDLQIEFVRAEDAIKKICSVTTH